ncbi:MAG: hypothetical protein LBL91_01360 [Lachnospiraceae bacterium]|jgi:hypothetical protein|nr:hypothetical protein [Lachnospiraceae bacterium]
MTKKKILYLILSLVIILFITGCGSEDKKETSGNESASSNKQINYINKDASYKKGMVFLTGGVNSLYRNRYAVLIDTDFDIASDFTWGYSTGNDNLSIMSYKKAEPRTSTSLSLKKDGQSEYLSYSFDNFDEEDLDTVIYETDNCIVSKSESVEGFYQIYYLFSNAQGGFDTLVLTNSSIKDEDKVIEYAKKYEKNINVYKIDDDNNYTEVFDVDGTNAEFSEYYYVSDRIVDSLAKTKIYVSDSSSVTEVSGSEIDLDVKKDDKTCTYYIEKESGEIPTKDDYKTFKVGGMEIKSRKFGSGHFLFFINDSENNGYIDISQFTPNDDATLEEAIEMFKTDLM